MAIVADDNSATGWIDDTTGEAVSGPTTSDTAYTPSGAVVSNNTSGGGVNLSKQFTTDVGETYGVDSNGHYVKIPPGGDISDAVIVPESEYTSASAGVAQSTSSPGGTGTAASTGYGPATSTTTDPLTQLKNFLSTPAATKALGTLGVTGVLNALSGGNILSPGGTYGVYRGYQGGIPTLTASRNMNQIPANYRPGGGGMSYFSPVTFTDPSGKVVSGVAGSGSPMNQGDVTGNITGPTSAGSLTPTNTTLPGGITTVGNTYVPPATTNTTNTGGATTNTGGATTNTGGTTTNTSGTTTNTNKTNTNISTLTPAQQYLASLQNPTAASVTQFQAGNPTDQSAAIQKALAAIPNSGTASANKTIADLMDKWKVTPTEMATATGFTPAEITNLYNQAKGNSTASVSATDPATIQQQLSNTAAALNSGDKSGIAGLNNLIAANPGLNVSQIQAMFPTVDLSSYFNQGVVAPGSSTYKYTPPAATTTATPSNTGGMTIAETIAAARAANAASANTATTDNTAAGINSLAASPVVTTAAAPAAPATPTYTPYTQQQMSDYVTQNNINVADPVALAQAEAATNADPNAVNSWIAQSAADTSYGASGGIMQSSFARGGYAQGGISSLGTYSDGGRMLKGPGDGVSDSIPAVIGGHQKAALADGEFVIPARIVSEIGNGSSDAGARKLYAMMDRIQQARKKTTKNVAANTRAEKYLPI